VTVPLTRRRWLSAAPALGAGLLAAPAPAAQKEPKPYRYMLNTSTIRGQNLGIVKEIEIVAKAGYDAIEPWIGELETYVKAGGSLKDLAKRVRDSGLVVESSIGFAPWIVNDDARRKKGLEQAKRDMDLVRAIGGKRIAAPPVGAQDKGSVEIALPRAAERYRALLEIGDQIGVIPQAEVWGFSKNLSRVGDTAYVAVECGHPKACILPDVYHLYKGGSDFTGLKLLSNAAFHVLHMNDYPANLPREKINDADRVYPGDGVAPLKDMLRGLRAVGYTGLLSLELFNRDYWKQDALKVVTTGLAKMKAVVAASVG
jgi:sugar phosphate isomerase/epimerase